MRVLEMRADRGHAARVGELPVLGELAGELPSAPCRVVLIAHLLDTAVPYVRMLGRHCDLVRVIAVPYSAQAEALALLDDLPALVPESIDEVRPLAMDAAREAGQSTGAPVVIQEVGGYCAEEVDVLASIQGVRGVVEDTKQGLWRYERAAPLPLPVYTIADSPLKALEDVQVGRSIAYSVERLLRSRFYRLTCEQRLLVLGYGGIGTALAEHFRRLGADVAVFDPDEVRMSAAVVHGFKVGPRAELLAWADVIVGVSGQRALSASDLPHLRSGVVLASGSSKQVEFDIEGLRAAASSLVEIDEVTEIEAGGRAIYLLNQGRPVNFLEQSILGSVLDLVYSELYLCTRELARSERRPGLHRLEPSLQQALARRWRERYARR